MISERQDSVRKHLSSSSIQTVALECESFRGSKLLTKVVRFRHSRGCKQLFSRAHGREKMFGDGSFLDGNNAPGAISVDFFAQRFFLRCANFGPAVATPAGPPPMALDTKEALDQRTP